MPDRDFGSAYKKPRIAGFFYGEKICTVRVEATDPGSAPGVTKRLGHSGLAAVIPG